MQVFLIQIAESESRLGSPETTSNAFPLSPRVS